MDGVPSGETFGPYRLAERLGRGGMGEVHRAYDTRRDRWVALKRLTSDVADDAEIRERFERECRVAARLGSPHVVPIHDFGVIDGRLFLDMRLVEGRDLGRVLREEGPLDPARAVAIVEQLAGALDAAHADGLVHRDVKPGNALVTRERGHDFVHLVDFGIVRVVRGGTDRPLTEVGTAIGTLTYMAPEQIDGTTVDHRADVYALAAVLFEALTGRPPFTGELPQMLHQHLTVAPPAPSAVRPGLPPGLDAVVLRGLAKRPDERFGSAGDLADAARAALGAASPPAAVPVPQRDRPTQVGPVTGPPRRLRWEDGPTGGHGPPAVGPPPFGPPPAAAPPTRRGRRALWIGLGAAALVAAVVAGVVIATTGADDTPVVVATGASTTLAASFPDLASRPGSCAVGLPSAYRLSSGAVPDEVRQCTRGAAAVAYARWPTAAAARERVEAYRNAPSVDGRREWSISGVVQGPYQQTVSAGECTIVAGWTGLAQSIQIYAPADRCADVSATFATLGFPTGEDLRAVPVVFPAAAPSACPAAAAPTVSGGTTPRETRTCANPSVSYTRWGSPAEVAREADSRRDGGPTGWTTPDGRRQGPYARVEQDDSCRVLLGWDAAAYAVEVDAPDCATADRTVAGLAPPVADALPA